MGGASTVWFLVYHFTNHVGFQESGKLKYPEVPRKLNSYIFMTLPLGFKSRQHWWKGDCEQSLIFLLQLGSLLFVVSYEAWLFLSLAISWQTSQWSVNSCKIDQSATPFLGWQRVCLLQKCSQSVFSRLVLISHCNIMSWFAIALAEIRTTQIYFNRKGWLHAVEGWQVL